MLWKTKYSNIALVFTFLIVSIHILLFPQYIMSGPVLIMGLFIILFFFFGLNYYSKAWMNVSKIEWKLFSHCLIYRLLAILGMYMLTYYYQPESLPFEIGAADAWNYHFSGELVANTIENEGNVFHALSGFWKSENDYGFSIFIGIIYYLFGPNVILLKIVNAIIGSLTAVRLYQLGKMLYNEDKAKLAGILFMLFPSFLWFSSMLLKETLVIFLLINIAYFTIKLTHNYSNILKNMISIVLFTIPLYYFRLFLFPLIALSIAVHLYFAKTRSKRTKKIAFASALLFTISTISIIMGFNMQEKLLEMIGQSSTINNTVLSESANLRGISIKQAIVAPFAFLGAIITPLPSLLHFDDLQFLIYIHFQNEIVRNFMYFLVFTGVYSFIKLKKRQFTFIFTFAFGYIIILGISGVAFQDRFQLLALPFLVLLIPEGLEWQSTKKRTKWQLYLFIIGIAILSWNLFKLSIRDLI